MPHRRIVDPRIGSFFPLLYWGVFVLTIRYSSLATALIAVSMVLCLTLLPGHRAIAQQAGGDTPASYQVLDVPAEEPLGLAPSVSGSLPVRKSATLASDLDELQRADAAQRAFGGGIAKSAVQALPDDLRAAVAANHILLDDSGRVQVLVKTADDPSASTGTFMNQFIFDVMSRLPSPRWPSS